MVLIMLWEIASSLQIGLGPIWIKVSLEEIGLLGKMLCGEDRLVKCW